MSEDRFIIAQAQEIKRMAKEGYGFKEIQERLKITKKKLVEILTLHYAEATKNKVLDVIKSNTNKIKDNNKKEVIAIDTSFLISSRLDIIEKFLTENKNVVIPGPVIGELRTNSPNSRINYVSRRIFTMLYELNIQVEIADNKISLDPTWKKNNDYYILTVCAKLKNQGYVVKLLSFDKEMILKARGIGIEIYPMEFPQNNVKHCNSYLRTHVEDEVKPMQNITKEVEEEVSDESLKALRNKFTIVKTDNLKQTLISKKQTSSYSFEKPVTKPETLENNEVDQSKPEIEKKEDSLRLIDNSSIDIFMGILKLVVTSSGKMKALSSDEKGLYYNIESGDKVFVYTKLSNISLEMKIGNIDENEYFIIESSQILQEGGMKKINKKYHESIKEAFSKLLKIKLKRVS